MRQRDILDTKFNLLFDSSSDQVTHQAVRTADGKETSLKLVADNLTQTGPLIRKYPGMYNRSLPDVQRGNTCNISFLGHRYTLSKDDGCCENINRLLVCVGFMLPQQSCKVKPGERKKSNRERSSGINRLVETKQQPLRLTSEAHT